MSYILKKDCPNIGKETGDYYNNEYAESIEELLANGVIELELEAKIQKESKGWEGATKQCVEANVYPDVSDCAKVDYIMSHISTLLASELKRQRMETVKIIESVIKRIIGEASRDSVGNIGEDSIIPVFEAHIVMRIFDDLLAELEE